MIPQTKINIALGVALIFSLGSANYYYLQSEIQKINENTQKLTDSVIELDLKYTQLLTSTTELQQPVSVDFITDVLMEQPEVIVKSLAKYQFEQEQFAKQEESKQIETSLDALYTDNNDPYFGNPNGKNRVVQFVDYNCGYCKKLSPTLKQLVEIDPEAKIIVKEYPIFQNNPTSAYSSLIATSVYYYKPELYGAIHSALMATPQLTRPNIDATLVKLGINKDSLLPHMDKAKQQIESVRMLGASLNVSGTPTVFIGAERTHGGFTAEQYKAMF